MERPLQLIKYIRSAQIVIRDFDPFWVAVRFEVLRAGEGTVVVNIDFEFSAAIFFGDIGHRIFQVNQFLRVVFPNQFEFHAHAGRQQHVKFQIGIMKERQHIVMHILLGVVWSQFFAGPSF